MRRVLLYGRWQNPRSLLSFRNQDRCTALYAYQYGPCYHTSITMVYWTPLINSATNSFLTTGIRYSVKEECQASSLVRQVQWMIKETNFLVTRDGIGSNDWYLIRLNHQAKPWPKASVQGFVIRVGYPSCMKWQAGIDRYFLIHGTTADIVLCLSRNWHTTDHGVGYGSFSF